MSPTTAEALQALADIESSLSGERECLEEFDLVRAFIESAGADSERWFWLASDCDGKDQDDFVMWLAGQVASKEEIDKCCDRFRARAAMLAARSTPGEG